MPDALTDKLCTRCGLCCDGSLFDDVELSGAAQATKLEVMGLDIDIDQQSLLLQPCTALKGTRCSIYQHRPGCCRTFECRVLQRTSQRAIVIDQAVATIETTRAHVARMHELCKALGDSNTELPLKERCIEALSQPTDCEDDQANELRSELAQAMDTMATLVHEHFLG